MKRTRFFSITIFCSLVLAAWFATEGGAQPNVVQRVAPGVWFREGDSKQGHCNNVIIEMKDYLIVVDANFPSGARAVMEDIRKISSKPVKYVFDTHHHGDHAYGNPLWTEAGAVTLAHSGVLEEMKAHEPKDWLATAKSRADVAELHLPTAEPPKQTFNTSPYVITDGTRRVEFHFFGWAHTKGDGFVYLPAEKILCTGDVVVSGPHNNTNDANVLNWPDVIHQAEKLDIQQVLPGHGPMGGKDLMAKQAKFFTAIRSAVEAAIRQKKSLDDLLPTVDGKPGKPAIQLPEDVGSWVGGSLGSHVRKTYAELTAAKPTGGR